MKCMTVKSIRNLGKGILCAAMAALLGLTPFSAMAGVPASNECKVCVASCMEFTPYTFNECFHATILPPNCDRFCNGADQNSLRTELLNETCKSRFDACVKRAGGNEMREMRCEAAYSVCKRKF